MLFPKPFMALNCLAVSESNPLTGALRFREPRQRLFISDQTIRVCVSWQGGQLRGAFGWPQCRGRGDFSNCVSLKSGVFKAPQPLRLQ